MRTAHHALALALAAAAIAVTAAPAAADDGMPPFQDATPRGRARSTWTLEWGAQARWLGDTSAASLTPGVMTGPRVTLARHLLALPGPRGGFDLAAFVRVGGGDASGQIFQTLDTSLHQLAFTGGTRLALALGRGFEAIAQVDVGAAYTSAVIGDELLEMAPVDDSAWGALGSGSIGAGWQAHFRGHYSVGVAIDLGYTVTSAVALRALPRTRPEEGLSIPTVYESIGHLDTRGVTGALTVHGGF